MSKRVVTLENGQTYSGPHRCAYLYYPWEVAFQVLGGKGWCRFMDKASANDYLDMLAKTPGAREESS